MKTNKFDLLFESIMKSVVSESELSAPFTCEICNAPINSGDLDFHFETYVETPESIEHCCQTCAEKLYEEHKDKINEGEFELTEGKRKFELWRGCDYHSYTCLYPESELKEVDDGQFVCDDCINGLISRGEDISIKY
jgi:hypothetical protein